MCDDFDFMSTVHVPRLDELFQRPGLSPMNFVSVRQDQLLPARQRPNKDDLVFLAAAVGRRLVPRRQRVSVGESELPIDAPLRRRDHPALVCQLTVDLVRRPVSTTAATTANGRRRTRPELLQGPVVVTVPDGTGSHNGGASSLDRGRRSGV